MVALKTGRSLRFAPDWPCSDAAVLFDGNSGDYWVVSALAAKAVRSLQDHGPMARPELEKALGGLRPDNDAGDLFALTVQSLADNGVIQVLDGLALPTRPADGPAD
jgi:hypothetical protein